MYLPAMLLFVLFIFYPFVRGIAISFTDWDGYSGSYHLLGLAQYKRMFTDKNVLNIMKNTFVYGCGSTLLQNIMGMAYAVFLERKLRSKELVKTVVYLPVIISQLIMGYIWYFFFQYDGGVIPDLLRMMGKDPPDLLGIGPVAVTIMTLVNTYQFMGVSMVIYSAGLQTISRDYYEAADMDGASGGLRFRKITFPLLAPSITVSVLYNLIYGLKLFDVIRAMTNGGPGYASHSLSTVMYELYFARQDAGYAAALGILTFSIIAVVSLLTLFYLRKREISI